jgi:hypothetical protein
MCVTRWLATYMILQHKHKCDKVYRQCKSLKNPISGECGCNLNKEPVSLRHDITCAVWGGTNCLTMGKHSGLTKPEGQNRFACILPLCRETGTPSVIVRALISVAIMPYSFIGNFFLPYNVLSASFVRKHCQLCAAGTGRKTITQHRSMLFIILLLPLGFNAYVPCKDPFHLTTLHCLLLPGAVCIMWYHLHRSALMFCSHTLIHKHPQHQVYSFSTLCKLIIQTVLTFIPILLSYHVQCTA